MNLGRLEHTFFAVLSLVRSVHISRDAYKEKSLWIVNRRTSVYRHTQHPLLGIGGILPTALHITQQPQFPSEQT